MCNGGGGGLLLQSGDRRTKPNGVFSEGREEKAVDSETDLLLGGGGAAQAQDIDISRVGHTTHRTSETVMQDKSVTVTPLRHQKSVTLTNCHCKLR